MRVIVAVDDSTYSKQLVENIKDRKWPVDTEFKVLSVLEPLDNLGDCFEDMIDSVNARRTKAAETMCKSIRDFLSANINGAIVHYEIRTGQPKSEIIDAAAEWSADRILIGAHGHSGCPHNLLGSVSRAVAGHAPCSVEVVRHKVYSSPKSKEESVASAKP